MTPNAFYNAFMKGELEHKNTFENRVLTTVPKFVQKKVVSTSVNEKIEKDINMSTSINDKSK